MAYINPNIFQVDFDNLTDWTDADSNGAVSEIDPAGQLHLDCESMSANGAADRYKDLGTIGTGDFYIEVKFKGDTWDGYGATTFGINGAVQAGTSRLSYGIGNNFTDPAGDGIVISDGTNYNLALSKTWDTEWHTIVFYIHNSQTDCDIWVDKDPATEAADVTDADCSRATATDGEIQFTGCGTVAGNGEYHVDYVYVGDELEADTTIFTDDFNSYSDGTLNGQGNWENEDDADFTIQGTTVKEGDKAVYGAQIGYTDKTGTPRLDGKLTVYIRNSVSDKYGYLQLYEGTTRVGTFGLGNSGNIKYWDGGTSAYVTLLSNYSTDVWYCIETEWRESDHKFRYRLDGGSWTDYKLGRATWTNGINKVKLSAEGTGPYFDYIAKDPISEPTGDNVIFFGSNF